MKRQRKCSVELYFPTERDSHRLEAGSGSDEDSNFTLELHSRRDIVRDDVCARYAYRVPVRRQESGWYHGSYSFVPIWDGAFLLHRKNPYVFIVWEIPYEVQKEGEEK